MMLVEAQIGFACQWYRNNPAATWSGTAWNLRAALRRKMHVIDVGPEFGRWTDLAGKLAYYRRHADSSWYTEWTQSPIFDQLAQRQVRARSSAAKVDAVLQVMDYAVTEQPFHVYQDLSHRLVLRRFDSGEQVPDEFNRLSLKRLRAGQARQLDLYQRAASVICMSEWLARDVVAGGVSAERVHVVPPGAIPQPVEPRCPERERVGRLIMVGADARRKGLDAVLQALPLVREAYPNATVTVVGPRRWPYPDAIPAAVRFFGPLSALDVAKQLAEHDLFVMPSQWEGFGIAFCEAMLAGLPCIGRRDCAMPEIIDAPRYGEVVGDAKSIHVDAHELAETINRVLSDDTLYHRVAADRTELSRKYSWDTTARSVLRILNC